MPDLQRTPEASVYRLSLYHCYLGERIRLGEGGRLTSRVIAQDLDLKEETVRRDMTFVGTVGRPGAGYDAALLFEKITEFLGLSSEYPIIQVGTAQMLSALQVVFPAHTYGVRPVAMYSELADDVGVLIDGIEVRHVDTLPEIDRALDARVALVACAPTQVQGTLDLLSAAGVTGVLLLTPAIHVDRPEGMQVTHLRMPCDLKSLACHCRVPTVR